MTVYADVLIIVNTVIDYFILLSAQRLSGVQCKNLRLVFAALIGGILSLYIFAPNYGILVNLIVWLLSGAIIVLSAKGGRDYKKYIKIYLAYIFTNALYGGVVTAFWVVVKPMGLILFNGIVYYQISPLVLLIVTVLCYTALSLSSKFIKPSAISANRCELTIMGENATVVLNAIIDTGHSLCDPFSERSVIIADEDAIKPISDGITPNQYRIIPYKSVEHKGVLNAFITKKIMISAGDKKYVCEKAIVAVAKHNMLPSEYSALISPTMIEQETECVLK